MHRAVALLSLSALMVAGCSRSDAPPVTQVGPPSPDAAIETLGDAGVANDAAAPDDGFAPLAPLVEPEPLVFDEWLVGFPPADGDTLLDQVERDTLLYPEIEGFDDNGVRWDRVEPEASGALGSFEGRVGYAVARIRSDAPQRIIARTDRAISLYLNGVIHPSDVYGSRKHRVPLVTRAGDNLIVVRATDQRGQPQAEFWTTPDELVFNMSDVTHPDLVAGDATEQYVGVAVLNLSGKPVYDLHARIIENDHFDETVLRYPAVGADSTTQIGFRLKPKQAFLRTNQVIPIRMRLEARGLDYSYERELELTTATSTAGAVRRTFRSAVDNSVQYYGLQTPSNFDASRDYSLILSLHGAGVQGIGQARSYSKKDWAYLIAPTNRRPFGFDWEEWGHLNGLNALKDGMRSFRIDPTRVYVTGHSMGGHGTWHFGVMHPGLFAVVGPSAGWSSFYSYGGSAVPTGVFGRSRAHSSTNNYASNLAKRAVYVIHGTADDNVPIREARAMRALLEPITSDLQWHEEPGAGHWWNGDRSAGVDCVDWPPLMALMQERRLETNELDFTFTSPSPSYQPEHAFVQLHSALSPLLDVSVTSEQMSDVVVLTTDNVRSMQLDGAALQQSGIERVVVDGQEIEVTNGSMQIGPTDGKRPGQQGPFNQVYQRPFCYVYADDNPAYQRYAAYQTSYWNIYGNGHACALPASRLTDEIRRDYNTIYLGLTAAQIGAPDVPFTWDEAQVGRGDESYGTAGLAFIFPEGERLSALLVTTAGQERLLGALQPFSSRSGMPDYIIWQAGRARSAGFFDAQWRFDAALGVP